MLYDNPQQQDSVLLYVNKGLNTELLLYCLVWKSLKLNLHSLLSFSSFICEKRIVVVREETKGASAKTLFICLF